MTSIAVQYIMQAGLLAAYGGSPILCEMWILPPAAAKSASNTQPSRTAEGSEGS